MDEDGHGSVSVAEIAAAIGEPARARMLHALMDGRGRTSTELSVIAEISASTASAHLGRLKRSRLVEVAAQGRHRYVRLAGPEVAAVLERLHVLAGASEPEFISTAPRRLRAARTCYDHLAGAIAVALHERMQASGWLRGEGVDRPGSYELSEAGQQALTALGLDVEAARARRRRFAHACLDWSERRPHLGGALGADLLKLALGKGWFIRDLDSRALELTPLGRRQLEARFGVS